MASNQAVSLASAMGTGLPPEWAGAAWIGSIEDETPGIDGLIELAGARGYHRARLLIRHRGVPRGFVQVPVIEGRVSMAELRQAIGELPDAGPEPAARQGNAPFITVAVSTRNRPELVRAMVPSLTGLDYPNYEILFVDNASATAETFDYITALDEPRVRIVREPRPGLSRGRNKALVEAAGTIVAFTDDDVLVDPGWLNAVAAGFARDAGVGLVTGMVPSGELRSQAQAYFEARSGWNISCRPRLFRLDQPPADIRSFPLDMSRYGTGANFAVERELAMRLGGFNEVLGVGSPTGGGEDLDMFVRVLYAGRALAYEPSSIVWHRHRDDLDALEKQMSDYAVSFSAWMTSLMLNPDVRGDAFRIGGRHVLRRLRESAGRRGPIPNTPPPSEETAELPSLRSVERAGLLRGPTTYLRARRGGLSERPLLGLTG